MSLDMTHPLLIDDGGGTNGGVDLRAAEAPPLVIRQAARKVRWLSIEDEEVYPGFEIRVWLNPSHMQRRLMDFDENEKIAEGIKLVCLEHNGWADEDGEPYPPVTAPDEAFWKAIPTELGVRIVVAVNKALTNLPNSTSAAKAR